MGQRCSALQPRKRNKEKINHRNELAAENGPGRQEKGTARASVRARLEPRVSARVADLRVEGQNQNKAAESEQGKSSVAGEERVLPPGRKESCRRGGKSPAAGEERVLPSGRRESCHRGGESPAVGEERVLPSGRKESCRRGGKSTATGEERSCRRGGKVLPPGRKGPAAGEVHRKCYLFLTKTKTDEFSEVVFKLLEKRHFYGCFTILDVLADWCSRSAVSGLDSPMSTAISTLYW
ncbi:hypothetical protein EMCRGX_G000110 [Ephydatia muelleri]